MVLYTFMKIYIRINFCSLGLYIIYELGVEFLKKYHKKENVPSPKSLSENVTLPRHMPVKTPLKSVKFESNLNQIC